MALILIAAAHHFTVQLFQFLIIIRTIHLLHLYLIDFLTSLIQFIFLVPILITNY